MKKIFLFFVCSFLFGNLYSQEIPIPRVDERIELLSTVFRLAGAEEYSNNSFLVYTQKVDEYFAPVKTHELINYISVLRKESNVYYDAVMSFAIATEITDNKIQFKPNAVLDNLHERWRPAESEKFLQLLNQFYTESRFHQFFESQKTLHDTVANRFEKVLKTIDFNWFQRFYGQNSGETFQLVISLLNGGGNYGPQQQYTDKPNEVFAILGTWDIDSLGFPNYSDQYAETLIHEYAHSFCNPLIKSNYEALKPTAEKFFKLNKDLLASQAYGNSKIMLYEILVRASVIKYLEETASFSENRIKYLINNEQFSGFIWIDKLLEALKVYENNRTQYPTLESFMPQIVETQNRLSPKQVQKEFFKSCAQIKSFSIKDKSNSVDPAVKELTLSFSQPMNKNVYGIGNGRVANSKAPKFTGVSWNETGTKCTFKLELEPNTLYSFNFLGNRFLSETGKPLSKSYQLSFHTKK